jgi:hypothetical protein
MTSRLCEHCRVVELDPAGSCPVCGWKPPLGGWADPPAPPPRPPALPPTPRPSPGQGPSGVSMSDAMLLCALDVLASSLPTEDGVGDVEILTEIGRIADDLVLSGVSHPSGEPMGEVGLKNLAPHNYASEWTMVSLVARSTRLGRILGCRGIVDYLIEKITPGSVVIVASWEGTTQLAVYPERIFRRVLFRVMSTDVPHFRGVDAVRVSVDACVPWDAPFVEPGGARGVVAQLKGEWT